MNASTFLQPPWWRRLRARHGPAQAALAWLLLALAVVPTLGRLHEVVHASALELAHVGHPHAHGQGSQAAALQVAASLGAPSAAPGAREDKPGGQPAGLLALLAGDSHTPADCLLLDQLALGDALHADPPALPPSLVVAAPPAVQVAGQWAVHVALFHARGPPRA